jgi:hypothetical protein
VSQQWRRCSACKGPIALGADHYVCSVSTCNRKRTGMVFCSVSCWEVHLPIANHREAWAIDAKAPTTLDAPDKPKPSPNREARRQVVRSPTTARTTPSAPREVLIVASRLKDYVRMRTGFNTSDGVLDLLSDIIRRVADEAIENARRDGRRTVLDRDIPRGR